MIKVYRRMEQIALGTLARSFPVYATDLIFVPHSLNVFLKTQISSQPVLCPIQEKIPGHRIQKPPGEILPIPHMADAPVVPYPANQIVHLLRTRGHLGKDVGISSPSRPLMTTTQIGKRFPPFCHVGALARKSPEQFHLSDGLVIFHKPIVSPGIEELGMERPPAPKPHRQRAYQSHRKSG